MYYEDNYHPNAADEDAMSYNNTDPNLNEYDYDNETISSLNTVIKEQRKKLESHKISDPHYHKIKISFINKAGKVQKHDIELYITPNVIGGPIRNAVTGIRYPEHKYGSKHEYLFFKAKHATGQLGRDSATLFYDTPEQFERHMHSAIDSKIKEKWLNKYLEIEKELGMQ